MGSERFRFGDFEFDAGSGLLRRRDGSGPAAQQRLAPQPARLLALLATRAGDVVDREEIRKLIWPDVNVDFEGSLHACVRQVRAALGESAGEPRYVETLPRRGYRMLVPVEVVAAEPTTRGSRAWWAAGLLVAVAIAGMGFMLRPAPVPTAHRIGVMPFRPPAGSDAFGDPSPIADWILEELTTRSASAAEIVGPATTAAYGPVDGSLGRLALDFRLDHVVNGRFLTDAGRPRLLAELIRISDGAHVWVRAYEDLGDPRTIGTEIGQAVAAELGLDP